MQLTKADITAVFGPVDDTLVADIIATGATAEDLAKAWAWVNSDEALMGEGRRLPKGKVAELADLLAPEDEEEL